jgi:ubiquitin fusion degradation protein 1
VALIQAVYSGPAYLRQSDSQKKESTIIFEVTGAEKRRLFCGVLEFTAEPGQVCLPKWVMDQLGIAEGQSVQLRRVNLPKGTDVKVQVGNTTYCYFLAPLLFCPC